MKPYYEDDYCTIYHGDCREVLPTLGKVDLVLTDPPYGVAGQPSSKQSSKKNDYAGFNDATQHHAFMACELLGAWTRLAERMIVTPGNRMLCHYPEPDAFGCFYQPASVGLCAWGRADAQPILYYGKSPHGGKDLPKYKCSHSLTEAAEKNGHPCPKPIVAWAKLLASGSVDGDTILDPFMGSGTTLRAAKDLRRKAVGIEMEEKYCEIAVKRLQQEVLAL